MKITVSIEYDLDPGEDAGAVERALCNYLWEQVGVTDVAVITPEDNNNGKKPSQ